MSKIIQAISKLLKVPLNPKDQVSPGREFDQADNYKKYVRKNNDGYYFVKLPGSKMMLESGDFFVLDIRSHALFEISHLEDAVNINIVELPNRLDEIPKDTKILLYCQMDVSSRRAGEKLASEGFEVYNMLGGFKAWQKAGYDYVTVS